MLVYMFITNFVGFCSKIFAILANMSLPCRFPFPIPSIFFILMACSFYYLHSPLNNREEKNDSSSVRHRVLRTQLMTTSGSCSCQN